MATLQNYRVFFWDDALLSRAGVRCIILCMSTSLVKNVSCSISISFVLVSQLALSAGVEKYPETLVPGSKYYFDGFDPEGKPWVAGKPLNIEEVFKNYQYVEIAVDHDGKAITVIQYIQGSKRETVRYQVMPDGALRKDE